MRKNILRFPIEHRVPVENQVRTDKSALVKAAAASRLGYFPFSWTALRIANIVASYKLSAIIVDCAAIDSAASVKDLRGPRCDYTSRSSCPQWSLLNK
jgi:hypothetical protein